MTLCIAWRDSNGVHFSSDSRLTLANNSYADVGIKVLALPYTILEPVDSNENSDRNVALSGELGMCFAGSAVNSLIIKEALAELLKTLQYIPDYTDISMQGIANFILVAYRQISRKVCETVIGKNGRAEILIGGLCQKLNVVRVFRFSTDDMNNHSCTEVLQEPGFILLGTGESIAQDNMPMNPTEHDYINVLKIVIGDPTVPTVGGNIQYGQFKYNRFVVYGVYQFGHPIHYWRGVLDLNSEEFMNNESGLIPGITYIDPYSTIGA
jgi:hypothetical protein